MMHTPGEWKPRGSRGVVVETDKGLRHVAGVNWVYRKSELEANRRLIMAAPKLLAALEQLKRGDCWCEMGVGNPMVDRHSGVCADAMAALSAARTP